MNPTFVNHLPEQLDQSYLVEQVQAYEDGRGTTYFSYDESVRMPASVSHLIPYPNWDTMSGYGGGDYPTGHYQQNQPGFNRYPRYLEGYTQYQQGYNQSQQRNRHYQPNVVPPGTTYEYPVSAQTGRYPNPSTGQPPQHPGQYTVAQPPGLDPSASSYSSYYKKFSKYDGNLPRNFGQQRGNEEHSELVQPITPRLPRPPGDQSHGLNVFSGGTLDPKRFAKYDGKMRNLVPKRKNDQQWEENTRPKSFRYNSYYDPIPEKDDNEIRVYSGLIDRRFNFFNLPAKAKVLLVSNLPPIMATPDAIFNVFNCYGDIQKVKIMRHHEDKALVEFFNATMANITRNYLDGIEIQDKKLAVTFSKYDRIRMPEELGMEPDKLCLNFGDRTDRHRFGSRPNPDGEEPKLSKEEMNAYFTKLDIARRRICEPTKTLHVTHFPIDACTNDVLEMFSRHDLQVVDVVSLTTSRKPTGMNHNMAYVDFGSVSDAIVGMAVTAGALTNDSNPTGIKVSFSQATVQHNRDEAKKFENSEKVGGKFVIPNDKKGNSESSN